MDNEYLSISEIARQLKKPESTIRYFRDLYIDFLPVQGAGRRRKYRRECLEIFKIIIEESQQKKTVEEIRRTLNRLYTVIITVDSQNAENSQRGESSQQGTELVSQEFAELENIRGELQGILNRELIHIEQEFTGKINQVEQELLRVINRNDEEFMYLLTHVEREFTGRINRLEKEIAELKEQGNKPWYKRIFR